VFHVIDTNLRPIFRTSKEMSSSFQRQRKSLLGTLKQLYMHMQTANQDEVVAYALDKIQDLWVRGGEKLARSTASCLD
jgi:hypothetical protein